MKLASYDAGRDGKPRVGVIQGKYVVNVRAAVELASGGSKKLPGDAKVKQAASVLSDGGAAPRDMIETLGRGEEWLRALGVVAKEIARVETGGSKRSPADAKLIAPLDTVRLRAPISRPPKITCVGLNYADHAREQGIEPPNRPIFFVKSSNTISGPGDPIVLPPNSDKIDYEAEFAVVIGKPGKCIPEESAYDHVAGYMILHDVTARDMQHGDQQWFRGKSCDTFAPTGPWIVTRDEVRDPHSLAISLTLNGEKMQDSNTSNLIFKVPYLVSYLSQSVTWETGDLISTGTPPGVGVFRKPPVFLKAGDTVSVTVEKLGTLTNPVASAS